MVTNPDQGTYSLHILRHAPTIYNEGGVIQGQTHDLGLSEEGKVQLSQAIESGLLRGDEIFMLLTSDALRTRQTSEAISAHLNLPVETEPLLREVDAGILAGKSKAWLKEHNPDALEIWNRHGDLDGIAGAETGDQLQARAIAFLVKLREIFPPGTYAVLSHAAFIRSLLNTIHGAPRQTIVEHRHLVPTSCEDLYGCLRMKKLGLTFTSAVYHVETADRGFVAKRVDDTPLVKMEVLNDLLRHLSKDKLQTPFLFLSEYTKDGKPYTLAISEYIEGNTLLDAPSPQDYQDICILMQGMSVSLQGYKGPSLADFPLLQDVVAKIKRNINGKHSRERAFLESSDLKAFFNRASCTQVVDHDCHYGNFIRTPSGELKKIDVSPVLAPALYQPASVLLSAFSLNDPENKELFDRFVSDWAVLDHEKKDLVTAMKIRACLAISYFDRLSHSGADDITAQKISEKYKKCFAALDIP